MSKQLLHLKYGIYVLMLDIICNIIKLPDSVRRTYNKVMFHSAVKGRCRRFSCLFIGLLKCI